MSDVESVLVPDRYSQLPPLDARMSAENTKSLLREADRFVSRKEDAIIGFEFDDSDTLNVKATDGGVRVDIGRNSPAFRLFKNPLFLMGQIRIEAELAAENPSFLPFIEHRNRMLNEFIRDRLPQRTGGGGSRPEAVSLPEYSLQDELVELHSRGK